MSNKYLEKIASALAAKKLLSNKKREKRAELSEENKTVLRTFGEASSLFPIHIAGEIAGRKLGARFGHAALGQSIMGHTAGGLGDLIAIKHSLHGKIKEKG